MIKRQMPPIVDGEHVVARPVVPAIIVPGHTIVQTALHFHHMGHSVDRPGVARLGGQRCAAGIFSGRKLVHFLQPKSVHAEHIAISGHIGVPVRAQRRDPIAQHERTAEIEIPQMGQLNGQQIARIILGDGAPGIRGTFKIAVQPKPQRCDVTPFAFIGLARERFGSGHAFA